MMEITAETSDLLSDPSAFEAVSMNQTGSFSPAPQNELSRMSKLERKRYREKRRRERVNASFDELRALLTKIDPQCSNRAEISQIELVDRSIKVINDLLEEKGQGGAGEAPSATTTTTMPTPKPQPVVPDTPRAGFVFLACYNGETTQYQIPAEYVGAKSMMPGTTPLKATNTLPQMAAPILTKQMGLSTPDMYSAPQMGPPAQTMSNPNLQQPHNPMAMPTPVQSRTTLPPSPTSVAQSPDESVSTQNVSPMMPTLPPSSAASTPKTGDQLEFFDGILMAMEHETDKEFLDTILSKPATIANPVQHNGGGFDLMGNGHPQDPTTDAQGRLAFPPLVDNQSFDQFIGHKRKAPPV